MTFKEQWARFRALLAEREPGLHVSRALGASNGPLILENAFRWGLFNIDLSPGRIDHLVDEGGGLGLVTAVLVPPARSLDLALVFRDEALERVGDRLAEIRALGVQKADKVRVYLHRDGVFLRQAKDAHCLDVLSQETGRPLRPTRWWYGDTAGPALAPTQLTWIGYVGGLLEAAGLRDAGQRLG